MPQQITNFMFLVTVFVIALFFLLFIFLQTSLSEVSYTFPLMTFGIKYVYVTLYVLCHRIFFLLIIFLLLNGGFIKTITLFWSS